MNCARLEVGATGTTFGGSGKGIKSMTKSDLHNAITDIAFELDNNSDTIALPRVDKVASVASRAEIEQESYLNRAHHLDEFDKRRESILKSTSLDIRAIYCSATGREIGEINLESCALTNLDCSDSQLVEELLLSCRPSSGWLIKRRESYQFFRKSDPVGLLTFLVASLFDAMESKTKRPSSDNFGHTARWKSITYHVEFLHNKILLRRFLDSLYAAKPDSICKAVDRALELDARQGLASIHPPYNLSFNQLVKDFDTLFPKLMTHCETELEAVRANKHAKERAGNYYAKQAANEIIRSESKSARMREQASQDQAMMIDAFLQQLDVETLDDLRDLNDELDRQIKPQSQSRAKEKAKAKSESKYKPPLNEKSVAKTINQRLDEYNRVNAKSHILSANKLKLVL